MADQTPITRAEMLDLANRLVEEISARLDGDGWAVRDYLGESAVEKVYTAAALRRCFALLEVIVFKFNGGHDMSPYQVPSMSYLVQNQVFVGNQRSRHATGNIGVTIRSISGSASKKRARNLGEGHNGKGATCWKILSTTSP